MRERGVQSRRVRPGSVEPGRRPAPPSGSGTNFWQALAIIALIAATAGWTTVAALALRGNTPPAAAVATDDPNATADTSEPPAVPSHDVPDLEAFLPTQFTGTTLDIQSATGDHLFSAGDPWSTTLTTFLTGISKVPTDLQYAYASDPSQTIEMSLGAYRVAGVTDASGLRDAVVKTWQALTSDVKISQVTLAGKAVTKGDDGQGDLSYAYVRGNVVYEILASDETVATSVLGALPVPGASGVPAPSGSAGSAAPSAAATPAPSASPAP